MILGIYGGIWCHIFNNIVSKQFDTMSKPRDENIYNYSVHISFQFSNAMTIQNKNLWT